MNDNAAHVWVNLVSREGKQVQRVKIPRMVFPPLVLQWGARFFLRRAGESDYTEVFCFFVTLESQYPQSKDEILRKEQGPREWSK